MSSTWNYRIVRTDGDAKIPWTDYRLIEAYYTDDTMWGYVDHTKPGGNTLDELRADLVHMLEAFDRPILTPSDLPREQA